jgi:hypothetical protein
LLHLVVAPCTICYTEMVAPQGFLLENGLRIFVARNNIAFGGKSSTLIPGGPFLSVSTKAMGALVSSQGNASKARHHECAIEWMAKFRNFHKSLRPVSLLADSAKLKRALALSKKHDLICVKHDNSRIKNPSRHVQARRETGPYEKVPRTGGPL